VIEAMRREIPIWRRSQLMGWLLRDHKVIAIAGTHGKSTTTAMTATILEAAGYDPTVLIGADVPLPDAVAGQPAAWARANGQSWKPAKPMTRSWTFSPTSR
jgi:UDP-N-acetylmuramate-alanine ligase